MYHLDNVTIGVNPPLIFVSLCKMKMFHTHTRERERERERECPPVYFGLLLCSSK